MELQSNRFQLQPPFLNRKLSNPSLKSSLTNPKSSLIFLSNSLLLSYWYQRIPPTVDTTTSSISALELGDADVDLIVDPAVAAVCVIGFLFGYWCASRSAHGVRRPAGGDDGATDAGVRGGAGAAAAGRRRRTAPTRVQVHHHQRRRLLRNLHHLLAINMKLIQRRNRFIESLLTVIITTAVNHTSYLFIVYWVLYYCVVLHNLSNRNSGLFKQKQRLPSMMCQYQEMNFGAISEKWWDQF